jgi:hypothetical protein
MRPAAACDCCGHTQRIKARGLCGVCYTRARDHGAVAKWGFVKADRLAEYAGLREAGASVESAAWDAGVSVRTGQRYEAELRAAAAPERRAA